MFTAAALLRLRALFQAHIAHWDAGTYTAAPLGIGPYAKSDLALFYAPPLVPASFQALFGVFGAYDWLATLEIALLGTLTVVVLFFAARSWFGAGHALLAAAVLAGMEYHVLFSRQALTDVPFTLFFLLASWAFTVAAKTGSLREFALAGLAGGAAQWSKYHGFFVLLCLALWLVLARVRPSKKGVLITALVFGACAIVLAGVIEQRIGLGALRANNTRWLAPLGAYVLPKTALFVGRCLLEWVSLPVLALALFGFARQLLRRSQFDVLMLVWTGLFLCALPFYANYPRLLLPLTIPIALAAAEGVLAIGRSFGRESASVTVGTLALLVLGGVSSWRAVMLRDDGYERAAEILRAEDGDARPDVLVLQHAVLFYLHGSSHAVLTYDEAGALAALERGEFRFLAADLRLEHARDFQDWMRSHPDRLALVQTIENPLLETALVNSAGFEGLRELRDPNLDAERRLTLENIRIWRNRR